MHTPLNPKSIAVLPFLNIGQEENSYFSDGITEEIISALTKVKGLKVTARTSSFYYKGKNMDARLIGNDLGVETLLEGSVRIIANRVRITAQLVRTDNGFHLWAQNFDRDLTDIFSLQDEISLLIADKIRENFGHFELQDSLVLNPNISTQAYADYLRAKSLIGHFNKSDILQGIGLLEKVIANYPDFALGYIHIHYAYNSMAAGGLMPVKEAFEIGGRFLRKAHELDMGLPEVHHSLGWDALNREWDFKNAVTHLTKALELKPNYADAHQKLFITLILEGNFKQGDYHIKQSYKLDPLNDLNNYFMGYNYYVNQHQQNTHFYFEKCFQLNNKFIVGYSIYALALLDQKRPSAILELADRIPDMEGAKNERLIMQALACCTSGTPKEIELALDKLTFLLNTESRERIRFFLIIIYTQMGKFDMAFDLMDEGIKNKEPLMTLLKIDPLLRPLHSDGRFEMAMKIIYALSNTQLTETPERESSALLGDTESEIFLGRLKEYFLEDQPFLKPTISLRELADDLKIHPNKLSWLLNEKTGKNFNDFINAYRLEYFKQIAIKEENKNITLLGLAYDSGFNSKTVFNTFFKKETGITPKQWVKANTL